MEDYDKAYLICGDPDLQDIRNRISQLPVDAGLIDILEEIIDLIERRTNGTTTS